MKVSSKFPWKKGHVLFLLPRWIIKHSTIEPSTNAACKTHIRQTVYYLFWTLKTKLNGLVSNHWDKTLLLPIEIKWTNWCTRKFKGYFKFPLCMSYPACMASGFKEKPFRPINSWRNIKYKRFLEDCIQDNSRNLYLVSGDHPTVLVLTVLLLPG